MMEGCAMPVCTFGIDRRERHREIWGEGEGVAYGRRLEEALSYAAFLHRDQVRKGTNIPYITHLLAVAAIVGENGGTEDEVIAALLHDAVEDQGGVATREEIRDRFGDAVVAIVDGTSDTDVVPKPPWRERKEAYVAHVRNAPKSVRLVSAADKLHNARSILADLRTEGEAVWRRFKGGKEGTLWYYRALLDAFKAAGGPERIVDELESVLEEIEEVAAV
jgi:(p)ppGpp synthase/HD superfamily hydrolase